ncbi:hypothetical protein [Chamaesiphon sp. VAR_48_metabat_403]|uniref:hypothetical protein n=1 Tax=Chamaesiphon sp. VAR_48_metabat_403 TaxID=2964700 RepID=UPI00286D85B3|nr:hypothetical protein [Chamaesiphon sp. VAR_48_metabat_403]
MKLSSRVLSHYNSDYLTVGDANARMAGRFTDRAVILILELSHYFGMPLVKLLPWSISVRLLTTECGLQQFYF